MSFKPRFDLRVAGLMPVHNPDPRFFEQSLNCLRNVCDKLILLDDRSDPPVSAPVDELIRIANDDDWNDYSNHVTLLLRAAFNKCSWVIWLDDDMTLDSQLTYSVVHRACCKMENEGFTAARLRVCEMWNDEMYRDDGIWGGKAWLAIQKNYFYPLVYPQMDKKRFHSGNLIFDEKPVVYNLDLKMFHWGMSTANDRQARYQKWKSYDPTGKWQKIGYDYMVDETNIVLVKKDS